MKRITAKVSILICSLFFALLSSEAHCTELNTEPGKLVITTIDEIRTIVLAKKGKISEEELDRDLEKVIIPVFDFSEMARRCLGANWKKATAKEQEEFVKLFSNLLSRIYLSKIKKIDEGTISYDRESVDQKRALVNTTVTHQQDDFGLDYRLRMKKGKWRVYDVIIENVSLVSNYRNEFAGIVRKDKMSGLIKKLREKKRKLAKS